MGQSRKMVWFEHSSLCKAAQHTHMQVSTLFFPSEAGARDKALNPAHFQASKQPQKFKNGASSILAPKGDLRVLIIMKVLEG